MRVYVDLDLLTLIESPGNRSAIGTLRFKRGTSPKLEVQFVRNGEPELLPAGTVIRFGPKEDGKFDGAFLAFTDDFTEPEEASGFYVARPSFNTTQINDKLLSPDGNEDNDVPFIELMSEFSWRLGGDPPEKSETFSVVVSNSVDNGNEAAPDEAGPDLDTRISELEQRINQMGGVLLVHPDSSSNFYEPAEDSNGHRGTALISAVGASTSGDTIKLGAGVYDVDGTPITLPNGVSLIGLGPKATTITGSVSLSGVGALINPGSDSVIADFSITLPTDATLRAAIGARNYQTPFANVVIRNIHASGGSDGFYISTAGGEYSATLYNCVFDTSYDNLVAVGADVKIRAFGCKFRVSGNHPADEEAEGNCAVRIFSGASVSMHGCVLEVEEGATGPGVVVQALSGSTLKLHGCTVVGNGMADILNSSSTVEVSATKYDPVKVSGVVTVADARAVRAALAADAAEARNALGASSGVWPKSLGGTGRTSKGYLRMVKANTQPLTGSTNNKITFSTKAASETLDWNAANSRTQPFPRAGMVLFSVAHCGDNAAYNILIRINGVTDYLIAQAVTCNAISLAMAISVNQNDYAEVWVQPSMSVNTYGVMEFSVAYID